MSDRDNPEVLIINKDTGYVEVTTGVRDDKVYFDIIGDSEEIFFYVDEDSLKELYELLKERLK